MNGMTDTEAVALYERVWGSAEECNRESVANDVRAVLAAPNLTAACGVVEWWGHGPMRDDVFRLRVLAGRKHENRKEGDR